ncbi:MAG: FecR family protein, partial [Terriglobales bacterium]
MKTQKHAIHAATLFGAIIVFFCTVPAVADSYARIVRLSQVKGDVRIFRALPTDVQHPTESDASSNGANSASTDNDRAILNMPISQGMKLSTGTDGLTEIEFEDGAILRVAPESEVEFPELLLKTSGEKDTTIHLVEGVAYFNANPGRDNRFVLVAGSHEIPLTHSARFRAEVNNQEVKIAVFAGTVDTKEGDRRLGVRKGQEATIDITDNTATVAQSIEPGNFDDWDKQRSQYHDAYYKASAYQSYPYYGSGDLKYYGDWYSVSGYGSLWQPSNV